MPGFGLSIPGQASFSVAGHRICKRNGAGVRADRGVRAYEWDGGTDCHSRCAHWLRNDMVFCKGCGGLPMVCRGGALPRPRATARVAPTEGYKK